MCPSSVCTRIGKGDRRQPSAQCIHHTIYDILAVGAQAFLGITAVGWHLRSGGGQLGDAGAQKTLQNALTSRVEGSSYRSQQGGSVDAEVGQNGEPRKPCGFRCYCELRKKW